MTNSFLSLSESRLIITNRLKALDSNNYKNGSIILYKIKKNNVAKVSIANFYIYRLKSSDKTN